MKYAKFTILLLAVSAWTACGSHSNFKETVASEPASGSHSISNSSSIVPQKEPMADTVRSSANAATNSALAVAERKSSAPAQPGRRPIAQNVSLDQATNSQAENFGRKIIRHADLALEADAPDKSLEKITSIAEDLGGYVVDSQSSSTDLKASVHDTVNLTIRVPAQKFSDALEQIRGTGTHVITENVKGDDVTEEFIDIEARLKAQRSLEAQFMEIMKRAYSVSDALDVQRELADVRGEIEKIEGRKKFLEDQSSLSTIKVRLQTPAAFSTNSAGFTYRLGGAFSSGLDFALNFLFGLVTFVIGVLPLALVLGVPAFFIVRYFWRKQTRPRSFSEIAKEELADE